MNIKFITNHSSEVAKFFTKVPCELQKINETNREWINILQNFKN